MEGLDKVKGGGRAPPPTPTHSRLGRIYRHDGMHARKWPLPVYICTLSSVVSASHQGPPLPSLSGRPAATVAISTLGCRDLSFFKKMRSSILTSSLRLNTDTTYLYTVLLGGVDILTTNN